MAKVTRAKINNKKFNKLFGANRPIMEAPKVVHTEEQRQNFSRIERTFCNTSMLNVLTNWYQ